MAKKETLVCKPCEVFVLVSDQGDAVIECYQCGTEMVPVKARQPAAKKPAGKKTAAKKAPAARKAAPKKKTKK
jgi:hypothetical protein